MLSFYGTPLDDLDAAIAADPAWLLPRVMKAGFLLNLTEPSLVAEAKALLDAAEPLAAGANERERGHLAALRRVERGDWQGAADAWGALLEAEPRDVLALQWALLFDFYRGDAEALRERAAAVLPAWSEADPLYPYVLGHHAFGLEESGRYAEAEAVGRRALAGIGARAVGDPRRRPCHGDAGPACRGRRLDGDLAAVLGRGQRLCRRTSAGTRRCSRSRRATTPRRWRCSTSICMPRRTRSRCSASMPPRCSGGWQLHGAEVGDRWQRLLAGWALDDPAAAGSSAFNDVHALLALLGGGERDAAARWMNASLANAARGGPWNREVSRVVAAPLMQGSSPSPTAASPTPPGCSSRCAAPPARASAAAMRSAT